MNADQPWEPLRSTARLTTDRMFGYVEMHTLPAWPGHWAKTDEENQAI
jgi:hypothetical protein